MVDSDTDVVTVPLNSTFDRALANIDDPDPIDLDRLAASLDALKLSFASNQIGICPVRRTASERQQFSGDALVAWVRYSPGNFGCRKSGLLDFGTTLCWSALTTS